MQTVNWASEQNDNISGFFTHQPKCKSNFVLGLPSVSHYWVSNEIITNHNCCVENKVGGDGISLGN